MTIGEKIKYFREKQGMTQAKLAESTGIHPVSIRKYETNKMVPQEQQIERIAEALQVNTIALNSAVISKMRFETVGDVMGVVMLLLSSGILEITWDEDKHKNPVIDTVELKPNTVFSSFLELVSANNNTQKKAVSDFFIKITHTPIIADLLAWYDTHQKYLDELSRATKEETDNPNSRLNQLKALNEHRSNWLQSDRTPFEEMLRQGLEIHETDKIHQI